VEVVERTSVTDQLVGIGQDLIGLPRLALAAVVGVAMYLRRDGVNMIIRDPV